MKFRQEFTIVAAAALLSASALAQEPSAAAEAPKPAETPKAEAPVAKPSPLSFEVAPTVKKPRPPAKPRVLEKWAEIDTDKDGKVSHEDIQKVIPDFPLARFNTFDKDKDKMLTRDELPRPGGKRVVPPRGAAAAAAAGLIPLIQQADENKDGKVTLEEFKKALPNAPESQFTGMDRNGDNVLDKNDMPPQADAKGGFLRADADQDGRVSAEEFKAAFPKSPDDRFTKLDKNKDGYLDAVDRALTAPPLPAPAIAAPRDWPDVIKNFIAQSDTDKDGKLTFEEFSQGKPGVGRETFDSMDTNKDGVISADDKQPTASPRKGKPTRVVQGDGKARFERADKDGDGRLTYEEAKAEFTNLTEEAFKLRDADGDGYIGPNDRAARPKPRPAPAAAPEAAAPEAAAEKPAE